MTNKEKVTKKYPNVAIECRSGHGVKPDLFYLTANDDYISNGFHTEEEAWADAAKRVEGK